MRRVLTAAAALVAALGLAIGVLVYAAAPSPRGELLNNGKCVISPPVNEPAWTPPASLPPECYE